MLRRMYLILQVMENYWNDFAQRRDIIVCFRKVTLAASLQNRQRETRGMILQCWEMRSIPLSPIWTGTVDLIAGT